MQEVGGCSRPGANSRLSLMTEVQRRYGAEKANLLRKMLQMLP